LLHLLAISDRRTAGDPSPDETIDTDWGAGKKVLRQNTPERETYHHHHQHQHFMLLFSFAVCFSRSSFNLLNGRVMVTAAGHCATSDGLEIWFDVNNRTGVWEVSDAMFFHDKVISGRLINGFQPFLP
jgi:hypothetical protein